MLLHSKCDRQDSEMSLQHYRLLYASSVRFPHFRISKTSVCDVISLSLYLFVCVFVYVCSMEAKSCHFQLFGQWCSRIIPASSLFCTRVPACAIMHIFFTWLIKRVEHRSSLLHAKCFTAWAISPVYHSFDWAFHNKDARSLSALWLHLSWLLHTLKVNYPRFC